MATSSNDLRPAINGFVAIATLGSYSVITIGAGHGIGPIGLFLVDGLVPFSAWVGIALTVMSIAATVKHWYVALTIGGFCFLSFSAWEFCRYSETPSFTAITAIPFLCISFIPLMRLLRATPIAINEADRVAIKRLILTCTAEPVIWLESVSEDYVKVKTGTVTSGVGGQGHYFSVERDQGQWGITSNDLWQI